VKSIDMSALSPTENGPLEGTSKIMVPPEALPSVGTHLNTACPA
jgi:hypothetical protein